MNKCCINEKNEITYFCSEGQVMSNHHNPIACDKIKDVLWSGDPADPTYLYKLEDGKVITTEAGQEWEALQYQRDRQYPSIGDQLDMQYHDQLDGTTTWKDAIAKVKADNPKE